MINQKLTQRDEVTDSNGEDIIHVVKDGVSYKQTKANFLNGIKAYSPSDVSAVWTGTGLVFDVTADSYQVSGKSYSSTAGQVTLDVADATMDRIDLIVAIAPVSPDTIGTVGKITGTPATLDLVVPPDYDPTLVFPIKQVTVKANSGVPFQTTKEIVFNEGTEWTYTPLASVFTLVTNDPYTGTKSIYANGATIPDKLKFTSATAFNTQNVDLLEFYIKSDNVSFDYINLVCQFQLAGSLVGRVGTWITDPQPNDWNRVQINKQQLVLLPGNYDELVFYCSSPSGGANFWIDNIAIFEGSGADNANLNISQFVNDVPYARLSDLTGNDYSEWATYSGTKDGGDLVVTLGNYNFGETQIKINDSGLDIYADALSGLGTNYRFLLYKTRFSGLSTQFQNQNITSANILQSPDASGTLALEADASGFNGNLTPSDTTLQAVAQKFDDYIATVDGYVTLAGDNTFTGANEFDAATRFNSGDIYIGEVGSGIRLLHELQFPINDSYIFIPANRNGTLALTDDITYKTPAQLLTAIKTVDGTGSGLDADFIDGLDSSRFLRSDATDTATGNLTFNGSTIFQGDLTFNGSSIFQGDIEMNNADGIEMNGRPISGLQNGSNPTDAVNKSQLDATRPYKVYTAIINQNGTAAPTAVVLENTLGGVPLWERTGVGNYTATLTSAFTLNKTIVFVTGGNTINNASGFRFDADTVYLTSNNSTSLQDGLILTSIEIRVYN